MESSRSSIFDIHDTGDYPEDSSYAIAEQTDPQSPTAKVMQWRESLKNVNFVYRLGHLLRTLPRFHNFTSTECQEIGLALTPVSYAPGQLIISTQHLAGMLQGTQKIPIVII